MKESISEVKNMFVRTYNNSLINADSIIKAEIRTANRLLSESVLVVCTTLDNYEVFQGTKHDCENAMTTLCEAIAKGASLISYYKDDVNETVD